MEIYEQLGCSSMWTCAPYQQPEGRPGFGEHVVGSESNAVGFVNSVLGARTNKYGDLLDVAGALVGRVPLARLHTDEGRRATHVFDVPGLDASVRSDPSTPHLLGILLGRMVGKGIGVIDGLDAATEDDLKAIAAAAASSGSVGLFHVVGITPEAPTLQAALQNRPAENHTTITESDLADARTLLTSASADEPLRAICVGTPHFSVAECLELHDLLDDRRVATNITFIATTSRAVANELELRGLAESFRASGVELVLDTCSYFLPRPTGVDGLTLTNSAKWAYYAQGALDVPVGFTSLERCVESAIAGEWLR